MKYTEGAGMKKVSELTGAELDYWALMARNISAGLSREEAKNGAKLAKMLLGASPSQNWAEGGAIIEREKIELKTHHDQGWGARCNSQRGGATRVVYGYGNTPLIAAMRCYVASVYGEYVSE